MSTAGIFPHDKNRGNLPKCRLDGSTRFLDSHDMRVLLRPVLGGLGLERRAVKAKEG